MLSRRHCGFSLLQRWKGCVSIWCTRASAFRRAAGTDRLLLKGAIMLRRISLIFVLYLGLLTPGLEGQAGRGSKCDRFGEWLKEDVEYIIPPEETRVAEELPGQAA